ncbi:MAG: HD domain-containing protein [Planctomycetota bacterium]
MQKQQLEAYKRWFTEYVVGFYTADDDYINQNIQLKECHTHRVCNEMRQLAKALEMDANDMLIAETIALFHDVGRFPQLQKYRTYKDAISENHSLLGLKVLAEHDVLKDIDAEERAIIEKAIEFHGAKELPAMDERTLHFAKMIRDADKIDIFELLVKNYRILEEDPDNFPWEVEYPNTAECSSYVINAVLNRELIDYHKLETINDFKLLQLGWVYDVYFDWSLRQIHDRGYLQAIIDLLPKTDEVKQATECVLNYTRQKIGACK